MAQKRLHLRSTVNAKNVTKADGLYTIREVCGAVDDIVMNRRLYPAAVLAAGAATLEGKPAPAGHPRNTKGQAISALNGEALLNSYIGSVCRNARHEGGRTLVDIVVNEAQAKAHPDGVKLVQRLDAAINGTNTEPIHVSTGLIYEAIQTNGEANGKPYHEVLTRLHYDHLAILLNERGAGTPDDGVGLFLNDQGQEEAIEVITVNTAPEDKRFEGLLGWVRKLVGNGDVSFDAISSLLHEALPRGAWLREVYARHCIWCAEDGTFYRQDYSVASDGASVAFSSDPVQVVRKVEYEPVTNSRKDDEVKEQILAALNAAGIKTDGLDTNQLLAAYNSLVTKPVEEKLTAANAKIAEHEATARAAEEAEVAALATALAVNSSLTVDDLKKLGKARLLELKAKAAPVLAGNSGGCDKKSLADIFTNHRLQHEAAGATK
jgi:hypothetical protein